MFKTTLGARAAPKLEMRFCVEKAARLSRLRIFLVDLLKLQHNPRTIDYTIGNILFVGKGCCKGMLWYHWMISCFDAVAVGGQDPAEKLLGCWVVVDPICFCVEISMYIPMVQDFVHQ